MYYYEYVEVHISGIIMGGRSQEHREIINKYSTKGFRYVGFIPSNIDSYGKFIDIELIFEKEIKEEEL